MNIIIKTKNIELTPAIREFTEEKIASIERYFNLLQQDDDPGLAPQAEVVVEVGKTTTHHRKGDVFRAEALITFHDKKIRAAKSADDLQKAIVEVRDDLQRQITDTKEKIIEQKRK